MNLVLVGYRCSGKTAVGKVLAEVLRRDFLDTDALIEQRAGASVETLVLERGWDHFRALERRLVEEVSRRDSLVIATGGGVVIDHTNVINLKHKAWAVWLRVRAEVLRGRMNEEQRSGRTRPSLTGGDPIEEITQVLRFREPLYRSAAELVVDTDGLSVQQVAAVIMRNLPKGFLGEQPCPEIHLENFSL